MKIAILRFGIACLGIIYSFFKLFPVRKKIVFMSRQANEPTMDLRVFSEYLSKEMPDYKQVMMAKRLDNYGTYAFHMLRQVYHLATSEFVLLDSYCIVVSLFSHKKDVHVIQMWHAIGSMKKFGYAMVGKKEGASERIAQVMRMHKGYDAILISSSSFLRDYDEGFRAPREIIYEIPLPRVDLLTNPNYIERTRARLFEKYPRLLCKKNILYCPTFRKTKADDAHSAVRALVDLVDFDRYNFIYKPHPLEAYPFTDSRIMTDYPEQFEMQFVADYVISDYSSVIYEAALRGVPIFLYMYDWDEYSQQRDLNIDLWNQPALFCSKQPEEIIAAIERDRWDESLLKRFAESNVRIPKDMSCCKAIEYLMRSMASEKRKR